MAATHPRQAGAVIARMSKRELDRELVNRGATVLDETNYLVGGIRIHESHARKLLAEWWKREGYRPDRP